MPIVQPGNDGLFEIVLSDHATEEQRALKARFDPLREQLIEKRALSDYRPLLLQLQDAARLGFDGDGRAGPNPIEAVARWGAIQNATQRLNNRPGRFVIVLPPPNDANLGREIVFQVIGSPSSVPTDQLDLKADIEDTLTTLEVILPQPLGRFEQYRIKLASLAKVGLQGDSDPKAARQALTALQFEILTREGPRVKNHYMKVLGSWATLFLLAALFVYFPVRWYAPHEWLLYEIRNVLLLFVGTMAGTWLSFGIRRAILNTRDLSNLEADMVEPAIRLVFTGLIAITFSLVFITNMINVEIGGLKSSLLLVHGTQALLIGVLFGVSEQALPGALTKRAAQFMTEIVGRP